VCPVCGARFEAPSAESFSFNSYGACPACNGLGCGPRSTSAPSSRPGQEHRRRRGPAVDPGRPAALPLRRRGTRGPDRRPVPVAHPAGMRHRAARRAGRAAGRLSLGAVGADGPSQRELRERHLHCRTGAAQRQRAHPGSGAAFCDHPGPARSATGQGCARRRCDRCWAAGTSPRSARSGRTSSGRSRPACPGGYRTSWLPSPQACSASWTAGSRPCWTSDSAICSWTGPARPCQRGSGSASS
jgi:hypothetical protein